MKKTTLILAGVFLSILLGLSAYGTQPGFVELNAEGRLEIVGEPEIGKDIEVIFTFTPLAELKHTKGIPDTAKICSHPDLTFIGGPSGFRPTITICGVGCGDPTPLGKLEGRIAHSAGGGISDHCPM